MGADLFKFKCFVVRQRLSAMKVGTDGVIVGSWAQVDGGVKRVLDVGTGTGLIAMMIAQRATDAHVEAVEIDSAAASEAKDNFECCKFADRLELHNCDFQSFAEGCAKQYDLVVSNPPYFNGTYKSIDAQRTAARHKELLPTVDLIDGVIKVLAPNGRFVAIFPYSDAAVFIAKAAERGLFCRKIMEIFPMSGRRAIRVAAEFMLSSDSQTYMERLVINNPDGKYTDDYKNLTGDFYIRF